MGRLMRLGVLGGTFDPPHLAHLLMAEFACEQLNLERVLWVVAADPPHKLDQAVSSVEHRLRMVSMLLAEDSRFVLSLIDVERPGPHYTVDMLAIVNRQYPGETPYFLIGADSLRDLLQWREPENIIKKALLAVMQRPGVQYDLDALESAIPGLKNRIFFIESPLIDISSAYVRSRVSTGKTVRYLIPPSVEAYIHEQKLYCAS